MHRSPSLPYYFDQRIAVDRCPLPFNHANFKYAKLKEIEEVIHWEVTGAQ